MELTSQKVALYNTERALAGTHNQVSSVRKLCGEKMLVAYIMYLINEVLKQVPHTMNAATEVKSVAEMLIRNYWHWRVEEFVICFRDGLLNKFGKEGAIYGSLNAGTIYKWCSMHDNIRNSQIENLREKKHYDKKFSSEQNGIDLKVIKAVKKVFDEQEAKHPKPKARGIGQWLKDSYEGKA